MTQIVALSLALVLLAATPLAAETPDEIRARAEALLIEQTQKALNGPPGDPAKAAEEALELYRSIGDRQGEALALVVRSFAAIGAGEERRAIADLEAARAAFEAADDVFAASIVLLMHGVIERQEGRSDAALAHLARAADQFKQIAEAGRPASLDGFLAIGRLFGTPVGPLAELGPMTAMLTPMLAAVMQGVVRSEVAATMLDLGRLEEAEAQLQSIQASSKLLGGMFDHSSEAVWGELRRQQWRLEEAKEHFRKALEGAGTFQLLPFVKDRRMDVIALGRLAEIDALAGRFEEALGWNDSALELAKKDGAKARQASVLEDRGQLFLDQNRFEEGGRILNEALDLARQSERPVRQASIQASLGYLAFIHSNYEEAARLLEASVSVLRTHGEFLLEASTSALLSEVYFILTADGSAESVLSRAKVAAAESQWTPVGALLDFIQTVFRLQQSGADARELCPRLRELLAGPFGRDLERARVFEPLARALCPVLPEAVPAVQSPGDAASVKAPPVSPEAAVLTVVASIQLGKTALELGDLTAARKIWQEGLAKASGLGNADFEAMLMAALAVVDYREGKTSDALGTLRGALDTMERTSEETRVGALLASYLGSDRHVFYDAIIELLAGDSQAKEAFTYSERARARALLHQLGNRRVGAVGGGDPELVAHAHALRQAIARWESELPSKSGIERTRLEQDIAHAKAEHEGLMTRIKVTNPEYASLVRIEPLDLASVQRSLEGDQTLLSYFVTPKRVHAWVVSRSGFEHLPLELGEAGLEDVLCFSAELGRSAGSTSRGTEVLAGCPEDPARAERLYQRLFAPLKPKISGTRLWVVPHGVLHYLPFATLRDPDSNRYLLEDYTVSYLPSASVLPYLRAKDSPFEGRALVLGAPAAADPDLKALPGAADEARQVAALWGTQAWLGAEATESRLRTVGHQTDLIHLAAHGLYNSRSSSFTRIALAPEEREDGNLEVHELLSGVDLTGVNLVVLSACETALGKRSAGDEVASLARAILYAGSPAVVSTLWRIDDRASTQLMIAFYQHLRAGRSADEALRQAQLALLKGGTFPDPFYWGAFTLTGEATLARDAAPLAEAASGRGRSGPAKRALLIGVGEYAPTSGWPATAAARDLALMRAALERQGFPVEAISELRDQEATREGIVRAIEKELIEPALAGDLAVLLFGGHGRQLRDEEPGDELDGYDEALVPFDAPFDDGSPSGLGRYLRDDALHELLDRLRRKLGPTGQVVVFLDTCYSGTGARGDQPERGAPPLGPSRQGLLAQKQDTGSGFVDGARGARVSAEGLAPLVVLSAARSGERALEVPQPGGGFAGSLSWAVSRALTRPPLPRTYRALLEQVRSALKGVVINLPQGEGQLDSALFLGEPVKQTPYFTVLPIESETRRIRLRPGLLAGLAPGTEIEIHPAGATGPAVGEPLAAGQVLEASPYEAVAELSSPVPSEALASAQAFVTRDAAGDLGPRLALNRTLRRLELHDPRVDAELEVVPVELRDCRDPDRPTRPSCQVVTIPPETISSTSGEIVLPVGSFFELRLVGAREGLFVNVLDLQSDGGITVLWPPAGARERSGQAKGAVQVLDEVFRVTEPCGDDVFLLITSAEPIDFAPLRWLDPLALGRGELERLGPFAPLFDETFLRGGKPPVLTTTAVSLSHKVIRIVPAQQNP